MPAADDQDVRALVEQNRQLIQQINAQQKQLDELRARLDRLAPTEAAAQGDVSVGDAAHQIRLSGEAGLGFFHSGAAGNYPNAAFRIDEAKVFVEAPIWRNVYFFAGMELTTREAADDTFHIGELFLDAENVFSAGRGRTLSLRAGRFNIPFGEEYQVRNVVDNPLVSHSLADLWGIDNGVQIYGRLDRFGYNLAVQNGGDKGTGTSDFDQAVTARVSYNATPRLHFSASAMRTGSLRSANSGLSAIWFGNTFFRDLGFPTATQTFSAELVELDASSRWKTGHFLATAGWINFDDDRAVADNARHLSYYTLEAWQKLVGELSGALRFSGIRAPGGYPLAGQGNVGTYFYNPFAPLTTDLQRLSLGLSYRFGPPMILKMEYSRETGRQLNGTKRGDADMFSTLLGLRF